MHKNKIKNGFKNIFYINYMHQYKFKFLKTNKKYKRCQKKQLDFTIKIQ